MGDIANPIVKTQRGFRGRPAPTPHTINMKKNWFTIQQVDTQVYAIAEFWHFEKVLSYLVLGNTHALLIDTGMGYESISSVIRQITRLPIRVLLTHTHWDHIGGVSEFRDVSVFDEKTEIYRLSQGFNSTEISELQDVELFQKPFAPKTYIAKGVVAKVYSDTEIIECSPWRFEVLHTPGHSPGSVCFFESSQGWLFTGDTLYPGPLYAFENESSIPSYTSSIRYITKYIDMIRCIYPGHNAIVSESTLVHDASVLFDRILQGHTSDAATDGKATYIGKYLSVLCK